MYQYLITDLVRARPLFGQFSGGTKCFLSFRLCMTFFGGQQLVQELLSQTQDLASRKHLLNFLPMAPFPSFCCCCFFCFWFCFCSSFCMLVICTQEIFLNIVHPSPLPPAPCIQKNRSVPYFDPNQKPITSDGLLFQRREETGRLWGGYRRVTYL